MDLQSERQILVQVARFYYEMDLNQEQIAARLNITRQKVSRLLTQARAEGVVEIIIHDTSPAEPELARQLQETFHLPRVILAASEGQETDILRSRLGMATADYLYTILKDGLTLGIGWGRTLFNVVGAITRKEQYDVHVVPLIGGIGDMSPFFQVNELARRLAEALGGKYRFLHAPAFTPDEVIYHALLKTQEVAGVMDLWNRLDVAIVGIGHVEFQKMSSMFFAEHITSATLAQLEAEGAVGDICGRFFDISGSPIRNDNSVLALDLEQYRQIPEVIMVGGGLEKARALLGALRGGWIKTLVTDTATARAVLREMEIRR